MPNEKQAQGGTLLGALLGGLAGGGARMGHDIYQGNKMVDMIPGFMRPDKWEFIKKHWKELLPQLLENAAVPALAGAGAGGALGAAYDIGKTASVGNETWVEGFVSECEDMGMPKEAAVELLKVAMQLSMCQDENFVDGFQKEMEKSAGLGRALGSGVDALFSGGMRAPAWAAAPASILGFLGLQKLVDAFQQNWQRSPQEAALLEQMGGALSHPDPKRLVEQLDLMRRAGHKLDTPIGGSYADPLLGGGDNDYY